MEWERVIEIHIKHVLKLCMNKLIQLDIESTDNLAAVD